MIRAEGCGGQADGRRRLGHGHHVLRRRLRGTARVNPGGLVVGPAESVEVPQRREVAAVGAELRGGQRRGQLLRQRRRRLGLGAAGRGGGRGDLPPAVVAALGGRRGAAQLRQPVLR